VLPLKQGHLKRSKKCSEARSFRKAIELGRPNGFVTFNQLDELLRSETMAPEDIETLFEALSDEGINVVEDD
jgi:RNA polymerase primary sigma factor